MEKWEKGVQGPVQGVVRRRGEKKGNGDVLNLKIVTFRNSSTHEFQKKEGRKKGKLAVRRS